MADSQDMEARLAAYVDGELPADARAEIENYLSANPQQRRLIADLMRQRDLLQALPKNPAPGDVTESLNAQLERAVLLGDVDAEAVAGSIRPWRNVAAIAAVLLLTGGLALTIYSLLPSPNQKPKDLATVQSIPGTRQSELAQEPVDRSAAAPASAPAVSEQEARARSALASSATPAVDAVAPPPLADVAPAAPKADAAARSETVTAIAPPPAATEQVLAEMALKPATEPATPALTTAQDRTVDIATNNASATRQQVVSTLRALGATVVEPASGPATEPGEPIVMQIPAQQFNQAVAVAQSFAPPAPDVAPTTEPTPMTTAQNQAGNAANFSPAQSQMGGQASDSVAPANPLALSPPTTLPSALIIVRLVIQPPPTTTPATIPSSEPASLPASAPTDQP